MFPPRDRGCNSSKGRCEECAKDRVQRWNGEKKKEAGKEGEVKEEGGERERNEGVKE